MSEKDLRADTAPHAGGDDTVRRVLGLFSAQRGKVALAALLRERLFRLSGLVVENAAQDGGADGGGEQEALRCHG